jgi:hypothetical protein
MRKANDHGVGEPVDFVEIDAPDGRSLPGAALQQFTAPDVVSRRDVIEAHQRATQHS